MNTETHDKAIEPRPLRRDDNPAPEDAELADLFRQVKPQGPLHELAVQRIRRGLEDRTRPSFSRDRGIRVALAVAASLFLFETFALAVSAWPASRRAVLHILQAPSHAPPSPRPAELVAAPPIPDEEPPPSGSAPSGPANRPAFAAIARPTRRVQRDRESIHLAPGPAAAGQGIDNAEVSSYLAALAELNVRKDPAKALKMLEQYRSQYPDGLFHDEVTVAEVRTDMVLDRDREALALLDDMQARGFSGLPQANELALLRVELLGRANRCAEALTLLVPDLQSSLEPAQRERLLFERGACDAQLGNLESGQQDLRDYLRQFPHGRFEAELRQRITHAVPGPE